MTDGRGRVSMLTMIYPLTIGFGTGRQRTIAMGLDWIGLNLYSTANTTALISGDYLALVLGANECFIY